MIHLHLPSPCHEDWDAMTPCDRGRHCASCQETVVDFTRMSDAQLIRFFEEYGKDRQVCGQLRTSQLVRPLDRSPNSRGPRRIVTALLVSLCLGATAYGQQPVGEKALVEEIIAVRKRHAAYAQRGMVAVQQTYLYGKISKGANGEVAKGAILAVYNKEGELVTGVVADERGTYKLTSVPLGGVLLKITHSGYREQQFKLPRNGELHIQLVAEESND